jgi:hypothetical protein
MSGLAAGPGGSKARDIWRAAVPLIVMFSTVIVLQGDRIEKDCFCTPPDGWAVWTGRAIRDAALLIDVAFAIGLVSFPVRAWRLGGAVALRHYLLEERHHVIAASVPWFMAVLGIVVLTVPSQTSDLLAGLQGNAFGGTLVLFGLGAMAWGTAVWFCGRWSIDIELRVSGRDESELAKWNPRLLAWLTSLAIVVITVKSAGLCSVAAILVAILVSIVISLVISRRAILDACHPVWRANRVDALTALIPVQQVAVPAAPAPDHAGCIARALAFLCRLLGQARAGLKAFHDDRVAAPGGVAAVRIAVIASLIVILTFMYDPQTATWLQAPATALLGLGCLTMIATYLSKFLWRLFRFPVLFCLLVLTTLLGQWDIGVNHDIRTLEPRPSRFTGTIDDAAMRWLKYCGLPLVANNELKVVLVSTAGGASRAGLWTFHALSDLEDNQSGTGDLQFPRRVFAISAVSGGALGSAIWSALLAKENFDCKAAITSKDSATQRRTDGHDILTTDFLAPVLAAWLARDVPLGVLPLNPLLRRLHVRLEDRSIALEKSWEIAWADKFRDAPVNLMAADFSSLYGTSFNRPMLLLNGTVEDTGQPILTAPVALVAADGTPNLTFPATYDAPWALGRDSKPSGRDIRTSTAVLNAARFPVVTSQGDIRIMRCGDGTVSLDEKCGEEMAQDHKISVVDGGYFDNIGAGTTVRIAYALRTAFEALRSTGDEPTGDKPFKKATTLRIVVIGINSDPDRLISPPDWDRIDPVRTERLGAWKWLDPLGPASGAKHDEVNQVMRCDAKRSTLTIGEKGLANTLDAEIAPVLAIVNTQSGHTAMRMAELNETFCPPGKAEPADYIMLSLCPIGNSATTISLPLNWVMPPATAAFFARPTTDDLNLFSACGNDLEFRRYHDLVAPH